MSTKKKLPQEVVKSEEVSKAKKRTVKKPVAKPEVKAETEFTTEEENEIIEATDNKDFEDAGVQATGQDLDIDKEQNQSEGVNAGNGAFEAQESPVLRQATEEEEARHNESLKRSKEADENFKENQKEKQMTHKADDLLLLRIEDNDYTLAVALKKEDETMVEFVQRGYEEKLYLPFVPEVDEVDTESKHVETLPEYILRMRLAIDKAMRRVEVIYGEKSDVWKSLFTAKAWLGKLLGQLGGKNPYTTKEKITSAAQIPATADVYDNPAEMQKFMLESNLEKVLILREEIAEISEMLSETDMTSAEVKNGRLAAIALTNAYINAGEANFELGYQLSVIRKG